VRAFKAGEKNGRRISRRAHIASGLRVPKAIGDFLMLNILRQSNGGAVAVDDDEIIRAALEVGSKEGLFVCPEGAACFAALKSLRSTGKIVPRERVVISILARNQVSRSLSHFVVVEEFADVIPFFRSVRPHDDPIVDLGFRECDLLTRLVTLDETQFALRCRR